MSFAFFILVQVRRRLHPGIAPIGMMLPT